ncbi:RND family efflux transporter MFP subunit [Methylopila capsulata]|uniref:Hemolysin secretion protein D n=1 Tax=Methylopila capsulata TaxID=61654 RepID=A0A9W6ISV9_9HYPH|nr:efflux RND transporter periplasmic adaptor subunit [Methylopila capsulata]MBM7851430.1 RND family efflux transporter MFP subunit [Methylopila capsulata]GLK54486.1 hemolysin secretion protein D [Methylopila capsulata]
MTSVRIACLIGAATAALALGACKPEAQADPRQAARVVQVAMVEPAGTQRRAFTGVVAARVQSNLGFRVPGKIVERLVDTGVSVKAGQPLMRIDRTDLDLAITSRERAVASADAVQKQAEADEVRYRELRKAGWSTQQRYEQAKAALDTANAQLEAAKAQAQVARNESAYSVLKADEDGVVVETLGEPGQVVSAGQVVLRIARSGSREASISLPESVRPQIGSEAEATLYGGELKGTATLRQLSDAADPRTRTYEARYVLGGDAAKAPLGATVTVSVAIGDGATGTRVPLAALNDDGSGAFVWAVADGPKLQRRPVKVARLGADFATLDEGLATGETVVATGGRFLREGDAIRISEQKAAMQ